MGHRQNQDLRDFMIGQDWMIFIMESFQSWQSMYLVNPDSDDSPPQTIPAMPGRRPPPSMVRSMSDVGVGDGDEAGFELGRRDVHASIQQGVHISPVGRRCRTAPPGTRADTGPGLKKPVNMEATRLTVDGTSARAKVAVTPSIRRVAVASSWSYTPGRLEFGQCGYAGGDRQRVAG